MAMAVIPFEAQQTRRLGLRNLNCRRQVGLRNRRLHVFREDLAESVVFAASRRHPPLFRVSQAPKVHIFNIADLQLSRQSPLRKTLLPRNRYVPNIDEHRNT